MKIITQEQIKTFMEKYEIDSFEKLEGIVDDYDNMAKTVMLFYAFLSATNQVEKFKEFLDKLCDNVKQELFNMLVVDAEKGHKA